MTAASVQSLLGLAALRREVTHARRATPVYGLRNANFNRSVLDLVTETCASYGGKFCVN